MPWLALASDYDGTLATEGRVSPEVVRALTQLRGAGLKLIMVTGRELDPLLDVFPAAALFHRIVAENGALLYHPESRLTTLLGEPIPAAFVKSLRDLNIPLEVGQRIVATREPHQTEVFEQIRRHRLALDVSFNKGSVMILPTGVNKASGLDAALAELDISPASVIGIGDAENDLSFLSRCGYSVAVANALPSVKEQVNLVTQASEGAGVVEIADRLLGGAGLPRLAGS